MSNAWAWNMKYIEYLDENHFIGYAKQLLHDNENEYYRGMYQFLTGDRLIDHEILSNSNNSFGCGYFGGKGIRFCH